MLKVFAPLRALKSLSPGVLSQSFCVYTAYLNPEKHIYMTHNPSNVYEDIFQIGDYPMPSRLMAREDSRLYVPQITSLLFQELQKLFPEAKLDAKNYENFKLNSWKKHGVTDIDSVKNQLLVALSKGIFVKEHKFRYPVEQKTRLVSTTEVYNKINLNETMIGYFVESYNHLIRIEIDRSNLWRNPKIKGDSSFLEKHMIDSQKPVVGVKDLERDIPENKSFINRMMAKLHTI